MTAENATDFFTASNQKTIMDKEEQKADKKPDNIPGWSIPYLVFLNNFILAFSWSCRGDCKSPRKHG